MDSMTTAAKFHSSKPCICCGERLPVGEFYTHPMMADGHLNKCKSCCRRHAQEHRNRNIEKVRAYDRKRGALPHRKLAAAAYAKTDAGKLASRRSGERYAKNNPNKRSAQIAAGNAIRDGRLHKSNCEVCGSERTHAHHDDYSKPFDVRWLCPKHHTEWHKKNGPGANG